MLLTDIRISCQENPSMPACATQCKPIWTPADTAAPLATGTGAHPASYHRDDNGSRSGRWDVSETDTKPGTSSCRRRKEVTVIVDAAPHLLWNGSAQCHCDAEKGIYRCHCKHCCCHKTSDCVSKSNINERTFLCSPAACTGDFIIIWLFWYISWE